MRATKLTQREMLRRLLDSEKLTKTEVPTVQQLYDDLASGRIGGLNQEQAVWAEQICQRCGIVVERPKPPRKKDETKKLVAEFDALPRPKKPPGK